MKEQRSALPPANSSHCLVALLSVHRHHHPPSARTHLLCRPLPLQVGRYWNITRGEYTHLVELARRNTVE